ncbi:MAG: hypothetical protein AB7Q81_00985 [Gammaproteobacteria bacterium]
MSRTFPELLDELIALFARDGHVAYLPRPLPDGLDELVCRIVRAYRESEPDDQALLSCLPDIAGSVLLAFAERWAAVAVRTQRLGALHEAAMAVGLAASLRGDEREGMLVMPLLWHAAATLGVHQAHLFSSVAGELPPAGAGALRAFVARKPEDQTLECMGYCVGADEQGFRYVRTW